MKHRLFTMSVINRIPSTITSESNRSQRYQAYIGVNILFHINGVFAMLKHRRSIRGHDYLHLNTRLQHRKTCIYSFSYVHIDIITYKYR